MCASNHCVSLVADSISMQTCDGAAQKMPYQGPSERFRDLEDSLVSGAEAGIDVPIKFCISSHLPGLETGNSCSCKTLSYTSPTLLVCCSSIFRVHHAMCSYVLSLKSDFYFSWTFFTWKILSCLCCLEHLVGWVM